MVNFLSMFMSILMLGLIGVILTKNIIGLIEVIKAKKVAKQLRQKALNGFDVHSLDNNE